jgi:hypothetical protein
MHIKMVEIFSDKTDGAVMRHPMRAFPGLLMQGDSLHAFCVQADLVCERIGRGSPGFDEADELRNSLWTYLNHYKTVLGEHEIKLPFCE